MIQTMRTSFSDLRSQKITIPSELHLLSSTDSLVRLLIFLRVLSKKKKELFNGSVAEGLTKDGDSSSAAKESQFKAY